jgi:hypothetical protein
MAAAGGDPPSLISRMLAVIGGVVSRVGTYTGALRAGITAELEKTAAPDFVSSLVASEKLPRISELKYSPTTSRRNIRGMMGEAAATEDEVAGRDRMVAAYNLAVTVAELKRWTGYEGVTQADFMRVDRKRQTLGAISRLEENSFVYTQRFLRDFYLYIFTTTRAQNSRRSVAVAGIVRAPSTVSAPGYPDLKLFSVDDMLTLQALYNDIDDAVSIAGVSEPTFKPQIREVLGEVAVSGTEIFIPVERYDAAEVLAQNLGDYRERIYLTLARRNAAMARVGAGAGAGAGANANSNALLPAHMPNLSGRSGRGSVESQSSVFPKAFEALTTNQMEGKVASYAGLVGTVAKQALASAGQKASLAANAAKQKAVAAVLSTQVRPREIAPSAQNAEEAAGALLALGAGAGAGAGASASVGAAPVGGIKRGRTAFQSELPATKSNMNSAALQEGGVRRRKRRTHRVKAKAKARRSRSRSRVSHRRR